MSRFENLTSQEDGVDYSGYQHFLDSLQEDKLSSAKGMASSNHHRHSYKVAPLFTTKVLAFAEQYLDTTATGAESVYPQYGLLGSIVDDKDSVPRIESLVFGNNSEPWSAFICGSQGSGKSYTLACLLENALLKRSRVNVARHPSTGIVFHYDQFSNVSSGQLCEAAYLCSTGIPVTVLVCPTSLEIMRNRYENLPCQSGGLSKPRVKPLYLKDEQLSTEIMMTLMAADDVGERIPLYISSIRQLLRQMILDKPHDPVFDYRDFLRRIDQLPLTKDQLSPLNLRLDLLKSVLVDTKNKPKLRALYDEIWRPKAGSLTIVDLSDPFITESDACALFSISLKLFIGGWQSAPRIIALDEAHKFLRSSIEAKKLTSDLISVVRQQRHLGSRVLVATQEPTMAGELLDLCNVSIIHRFTSPQWYSTLRQHLIAAHGKNEDQSFLHEIAGLNTGQAMVFCPTAILDVSTKMAKPSMLHETYFKLAVRSRISTDGGESILPAHHRRIVNKHLNDDNASTHSVATSKSSDDGASVLVGKDQSPIAMTYQMQSWTEAELECLIYGQIKILLGSKPVKDPWSIVSSAFRALEKRCGVPERFFADNKLGTGCEDRCPKDMMKRLLRKYYDELQVPRNQRASIKWLRD